MAPRITPRQKQQFLNLIKEGWTTRAASRDVGIHYNSGRAIKLGVGEYDGATLRALREEATVPQGPIAPDKLCSQALAALDDFAYFRYRYLGRRSMQWQEETAAKTVELMATPQKEFVVENAPPGPGKTTLLHDLACWLTARDRRIRGLFGSRVENNGRRQCRRVRRSLERTSPPKAPTELIERGLAVDAEACMAKDYGAFKPLTSDIWKADEFVVAQVGDVAIEEKEPTWSAYGMDSGVLGNRFNVIFWDDVVDKNTIRTIEAVENQRDWWDTEAETRLEPNGLLILVGQRMAAQDLYRYCLTKNYTDDDGNDWSQYQHIVYKAHYDELCRGAETHRTDAPAWPEGCLLDPYRLPWRDLKPIMTNKKRVYQVSYQQEDVDPDETLCKTVWIDGGLDVESGEMSPGCADTTRHAGEVPKGLAGPVVSMASVDPSGKKAWAVGWWLHSQPAELTYLIDLFNEPMPANELLDWNAQTGEFYGLMEEWQKRSVELGHRITHWVIEINAAQRYLLAYDHVRRWMAKWKVSIIPHTTTLKKADEDYGPWIMRERFRHGQVRLPAHNYGNRRVFMKMREELCRFPSPGPDDCVMMAWFFFANLPKYLQTGKTGARMLRPTWSKPRELAAVK